MEKLRGAESPADGRAAGGWMLLSLSPKLPGCTLRLRPGYMELETGWAPSKIPHHPPLSSPCSTLPSPSHAAHHPHLLSLLSPPVFIAQLKKFLKKAHQNTHPLPGFLSAKQDFPIRFSALISCYRSWPAWSAPAPIKSSRLPESGLALCQLSACSPVCPPASRRGFVALRRLDCSASLWAAPVLQLYQSGQTALFRVCDALCFQVVAHVIIKLVCVILSSNWDESETLTSRLDLFLTSVATWLQGWHRFCVWDY